MTLAHNNDNNSDTDEEMDGAGQHGSFQISQYHNAQIKNENVASSGMYFDTDYDFGAHNENENKNKNKNKNNNNNDDDPSQPKTP